MAVAGITRIPPGLLQEYVGQCKDLKFEADTSEDNKDEGEECVEEEAALPEINILTLLMFVHPSEMCVSIRVTSTW
jgi:hypothetical protein